MELRLDPARHRLHLPDGPNGRRPALLFEAVADAHPLDPLSLALPPGTAGAQILAIEDSHLAAQFGAQCAPELFDAYVGGQIGRSLGRGAAEVAAAHEASLARAVAMARSFLNWDFLLCPTTACVAWPLGRRHPEQVEAGRRRAASTPLSRRCSATLVRRR